METTEALPIREQVLMAAKENGWTRTSLIELLQTYKIPETPEDRTAGQWEELLRMLSRRPEEFTGKRREFDFYPTPAGATEALFQFYPHPITGVALECCQGEGDITKILVAHGLQVISNDVDEKRQSNYCLDVTQPYNWNVFPEVDWVITNPPFSKADDIVPLAYEKAKVGIAMFLRISWMEPTVCRGNWLAKHPPTYMIYPPRISFTGDGKTDNISTAWFIWHKGHPSNCTVVPKPKPDRKVKTVVQPLNIPPVELGASVQDSFSAGGESPPPMGYPDTRYGLIETAANGARYVPEGGLNLFCPPFELPEGEYTPLRELPDYNQARKIAIDIETEGLNENRDRVLAIGVKEWDQEESYGLRIFCDESERALLRRFVLWTSSVSSAVLFLHFGYEFDLPFVATRCALHGLDFPFFRCQHTTKFGHIKERGQSYQVTPWKSNNPKLQVLDTLMMLRLWDSVTKKLTQGYSLKTSTRELGLAGERVLLDDSEMSQMAQLWQTDRDRVLKYLEDDLNDTIALGEFLLPISWGLQSYLPYWDLTRAICSGNGSKWQEILYRHYWEWPEKDVPVKYQGALRVSKAGLFKEVYSVDVTSLYPSIMLRYGVYARLKDPHCFLLKLLNVMRTERLQNKELGKKDRQKQMLSDSQKILINSAYGALGTQIGYNDYGAATLVPAYGREILRLLVTVIERTSGQAINVDTDGIFFNAPNPQSTLTELYSCLPEGIELDRNYQHYEWIYIPKLDASPEDGEYLGLRCTYMYSQNGKIGYSGTRWTGRDRYPYTKIYETELVKAFISSGIDGTNQYAAEWERKLLEGKHSPEIFVKRSTIPKGPNGWKLQALGEIGDKVRIYQSYRGKERFPVLWTGAVTEPLNLDYYLGEARKLYQSVKESLCG